MKPIRDILVHMAGAEAFATIAFVQALSPEERLSRRAFPWDASQSASVEEIVWHVVTHEQYHRGQIFTRLALLGRQDLPDHDLLR
jgi:uncharacterized damage-inducible protein DinB